MQVLVRSLWVGIVAFALSGNVFGDDRKAEKTRGEALIESYQLGWQDLPHYQNPWSNSPAVFDRQMFIETYKSKAGATGDISANILKTLYANFLDERSDLSSTEKIDLVNLMGVEIDLAVEQAQFLADPFSKSKEGDLVLDLIKEVKVPGKSIPLIGELSEGAETIKNGGVEFVDYVRDKVLGYRNGDSANDDRAEQRTEGQKVLAGYRGVLSVVGGPDLVLGAIFDSCRSSGCPTADHFAREMTGGVSPFFDGQTNLQYADPALKGVLVGELESKQRAKLLTEEVREGVETTLTAIDEQTGTFLQEFSQVQGDLNEQRKILTQNQQRLGVLEEHAEKNAEEIQHLKGEIRTVKTKIRQTLKAVEANRVETKRRIDQLYVDVAEFVGQVRDELNQNIATYFQQQEERQRARFSQLSSQLHEIAAQQRKAMEEAEFAKKSRAIDSNFQSQVQILDSVVVISGLFIKDARARETIRIAQISGKAFLQMVRAFEHLELAMSAGELSGAALVAFTGNFLGAFAGVVSAFGPSPQAAIFEQLIAIRQELYEARKEIQRLREEMHERFDLLADQLDHYFFYEVDRHRDVISLVVDVQKGQEEIAEQLNTLQLSQSQLQLELPRMEVRLIDGMIAAMRRQQRVDFQHDLDTIRTGGLNAENFVSVYSRAYAHAEQSARDPLSLKAGYCTHVTASSAFDCLPNNRQLPENYLWQFIKNIPFDTDIQRDFIFPSAEVSDPWIALFAHAIEAGIPADVDPVRVQKVRDNLNDKLDALDSTLEAREALVTAIRTPRVDGSGVASFPIIQSVLEDYEETYVHLIKRLKAIRARAEAELKPSTERLVPQEYPVKHTTKRVTLPTELVMELLPDDLLKYTHAFNTSARDLTEASRVHNRLSWEVEFSWDSDSWDVNSYVQSKPLKYRVRHGNWLKGDNIRTHVWDALVTYRKTTARPKISLRGFLVLPSEKDPEGKAERVLIIHRTMLGSKSLTAQTSYTVAPFPKHIKRHAPQYDEITKFLAEPNSHYYDVATEVLYALAKPDSNEKKKEPGSMKTTGSKLGSALKSIFSRTRPYESFWREVIDSSPESWVDSNATDRLQRPINAFVSNTRSLWELDTLRAMRAVASGMPVLPVAAPKEEMEAVRFIVRSLCGYERLAREMLLLAFPGEQFASLRRLGSLEFASMANLSSLKEDSSLVTQGVRDELSQTAQQIVDGTLALRSAPDAETLRTLLKEARRSL